MVFNFEVWPSDTVKTILPGLGSYRLDHLLAQAIEDIFKFMESFLGNSPTTFSNNGTIFESQRVFSIVGGLSHRLSYSPKHRQTPGW